MYLPYIYFPVHLFSGSKPASHSRGCIDNVMIKYYTEIIRSRGDAEDGSKYVIYTGSYTGGVKMSNTHFST